MQNKKQKKTACETLGGNVLEAGFVTLSQSNTSDIIILFIQDACQLLVFTKKLCLQAILIEIA